MRNNYPLLGVVLLLAGLQQGLKAAGTDEFKIKRKAVFEFAQAPRLERRGDLVDIFFTAKDFCDATVVVEDSAGRIVRHLASGVLGVKAPSPFQSNKLEQKLVWDGKDDRGIYVEDVKAHAIRVSLGLKPQFERSLFWLPARRPSYAPPLFAAAPEGVYWYQGGTAIDQVILYDHQGKYKRTVYPFPHDKVGQVKGLIKRPFLPDGKRFPQKTNFLQCSMLTCGSNAGEAQAVDPKTGALATVLPRKVAHYNMHGYAAMSMAVRGPRLALAHIYLNRLGTDGTSAGLFLHGPKLELKAQLQRRNSSKDTASSSYPRSVAFSPDGGTLYMTGYMAGTTSTASQDLTRLGTPNYLPVVMKLDYASNKPMEVFAGAPEVGKDGTGKGQFRVPTSLDVDAKGRVYVGDFFNDRVQVFDATGKHLKNIKAYRPSQVCIHQKTGELYVFSFWVRNQFQDKAVKRLLTRYGPYDNPVKKGEVPLTRQTPFTTSWGSNSPVEFVAAIDSWSAPVRIWISEPGSITNVLNKGKYSSSRVMEWDGDKLKTVHDLAQDVLRQKVALKSAVYNRQRLCVNPTDGKLYLSEADNSANGKSFKDIYEVDPENGKIRHIQIPFNAEDMCFDVDGHVYLRTVNVVARYESVTQWREVPWDYGEERTKVGFGWMSGMRHANLISSLILPANGNWHHGGMYISPQGHLVVACGLNFTMHVRTNSKYVHRGDPYKPYVFPGRSLGGRAGASTIHVWDRHGKTLYEDIAPGLANLNGIAIDREDNLYVMAAETRVIDGKRLPNRESGTLIKFPKAEGRVLSDKKGVPVRLSEDQLPKRSHDLEGAGLGKAWVEGAEWMYGGVGFGGKNPGIGCGCWNARFTFDYLNRSYVPEMDRYSIAVLDAAGNLILRIGQYGNADDGKPLKADGEAKRLLGTSIGGDEVALFHAPYLATHTDKRLFIADPGNGRILSVKLGYHTGKVLAVKDAKGLK